MSHGTHCYSFNSLEEIEDFLKDDLKRMRYSIKKYGFVCEEQYENATAKLIEEHGVQLMDILAKETGEEIICDYASKTAAFFLYAPGLISREEAIKRTNEFQREFFGDIY